jgi:hypothetical protein
MVERREPTFCSQALQPASIASYCHAGADALAVSAMNSCDILVIGAGAAGLAVTRMF